MKKLSIYLIALLIVPAMLITSCKDKDPIDPIPDPAIEILVDYLTTNSMDINHILGDKTAGTFFATAAAEDMADNFSILDLRSAEVFDTAHIDGAKNIAFADILDECEAADKPVLMVCYTGQTACYATALCRLAGYTDTKALKWGMSGWHSNFAIGKWDNVIGTDLAAASSNWNTTATPTETFSLPTLTETITDPSALLNARIEAVIAEGFKNVTGSEVLDNPTDYFVNNKFPEEHYNGFGHIAGAYKIDPITIADDVIKGYNPEKKVVTYCYTGQTSAMITAYLRVLGYDAYSLLFGVNGLSHANSYWTDGSVSNHWSLDTPKDFNYWTSK
jgi:rhodanese-related sulfurtransferase